MNFLFDFFFWGGGGGGGEPLRILLGKRTIMNSVGEKHYELCE